MKKAGVLHPGLAAALAGLGHGHSVVVADAGLPLPAQGPRIVDLALTFSIPSFSQVLSTVLAEIVVEQAVIAQEAAGGAPEAWVRSTGLVPAMIAHERFKADLAQARLIIRSGEATPYANVLLRCGVPF